MCPEMPALTRTVKHTGQGLRDGAASHYSAQFHFFPVNFHLPTQTKLLNRSNMVLPCLRKVSEFIHSQRSLHRVSFRCDLWRTICLGYTHFFCEDCHNNSITYKWCLMSWELLQNLKNDTINVCPKDAYVAVFYISVVLLNNEKLSFVTHATLRMQTASLKRKHFLNKTPFGSISGSCRLFHFTAKTQNTINLFNFSTSCLINSDLSSWSICFKLFLN